MTPSKKRFAPLRPSLFPTQAPMEFVFVVPRDDIFPDCYPHGLVPFGEELSFKSFEQTVTEHGFFVERPRAEQEPAWKQVIPYTALVRDDEVFLVRRLKQGGEARLHDKLSIGIGGHVNPVDLPSEGPRNPIAAATRRELEEELNIEGTWDLTPLGMLNDETNPVGAVHVGYVQIAHLTGDASVREVDQLKGDWTSLEELARLAESDANFETWSSLLLPHLFAALPKPTPTA
jgi:predicted NUDIX family phosphoesterase